MTALDAASTIRRSYAVEMSAPSTEPAYVFKDGQTPGDWHVQWTDDDAGFEIAIFSYAADTDDRVRRDKMNRRSILSVFVTISLGLALFGITAGSTVSAAEIKILSASALHPVIDVLIPDFEKSSGHKIMVAYG